MYVLLCRRAESGSLQFCCTLAEHHDMTRQQLLPSSSLQANKIQGAEEKKLHNNSATDRSGVAPVVQPDDNSSMLYIQQGVAPGYRLEHVQRDADHHADCLAIMDTCLLHCHCLEHDEGAVCMDDGCIIRLWQLQLMSCIPP